MRQKDDLKPINDTEAKILKAAENEFMTKGFVGARTTSIAEAAGVTHAMFHYYFRTKEKLFESIIADKMSMLRQLVVESFEDINLPLNIMIRNLIDQHLDFISSNPGLPRFLVCEVFTNPERLSFFTRQIADVAPDIIGRLQRRIDEMASRGECRSVDAKMLMIDIISLNVFPFIASPMLNRVLGDGMGVSSDFAELRKRENYDTIMHKLRP